MKLRTPFLIGGAIAACAGLSLAGAPAPATAPVSDTLAPVVAAPPTMSARDRRERFNDRVQAMLEAGEGSRLTDAPPARRRAQSSSQPRSSSSAGARPTPVAVATPTVASIPMPTSAPASGGLRTIALPDSPSRTIAAALTRPTNAVDCLTQAIYYEARSESEEGQAAVAEVILNRARSGRYPAEVCDVVYQRNARTCQFSYTCDGSIGRTRVNARSWATAERIARQVYGGQAQALLPARSVNYHANYVAPSWGRRLERVRQIGAHIFYGAALNGGTPGASDDAPVAARPSGQLTFVRLDALDRAYDLFRTAVEPVPAAQPTATAAE
ncbi:cell wall hydrolase [Brevundimonas sp.]|uniref:cell wall hydrolase n=1 Tax=Brevundimonas sp. TaxID=1871086 RepID=UPI003D1374F5